MPPEDAPARRSFAPRNDLPIGPAPPRARWPWVVAALVVVAVACILLLLDASQQDRAARESRAADVRIEALKQRIARQQAPKPGAALALRPRAGASAAERLRARKALVGAAEASILGDARARARAGELETMPQAAQCGPLLKSKEAVPDDRRLGLHIGRYDCVAITSDVRDAGASVGSLGYAFVAALDFDRFTYTWCRNNPAQGEAGKALVFVRLDRRCLATKGRALGKGYVDDGRR
jgi:hypothetical protein